MQRIVIMRGYASGDKKSNKHKQVFGIVGWGPKLFMSCFLRWAKSRDSYRRIASESYRCDSPPSTEMSPHKPCVRCAAIRIDSSHRAQKAKMLICTKSGVSANSWKSAKKCAKPHCLYFLPKKYGVCTVSCPLSGIGGNPAFSIIRFGFFWALWLELKYASLSTCLLQRYLIKYSRFHFALLTFSYSPNTSDPTRMAYRSPKTGFGGGYRRKSLPVKPIALQGASHEIDWPTSWSPPPPPLMRGRAK